MNVTRHLIVTLTIMALSGCGEFAYKTGAGADALAADKATCQQAGGAYQKCMHDKGWSISNLSADDASAAPMATADPAVPPAAAPSAPGAIAATSVATSSVQAIPGPVPVDPMVPVKMTAWVRFGSGSPNGDIEACVATLGPANAPDTVHHTATRALLSCMRQKGWRGL
jgi:hypothetical protein